MYYNSSTSKVSYIAPANEVLDAENQSVLCLSNSTSEQLGEFEELFQ